MPTAAERVPQRHAAVGERRRVDQDEIDAGAGCVLYRIDEFGFIVALQRFDRDSGGGGNAFEAAGNGRQRRAAVNGGFALSNMFRFGPCRTSTLLMTHPAKKPA